MNDGRAGLVKTGVGILLVVLLLSALVPALTGPIDRFLLNTWYSLRGEQPADSSIVVLYFTGDDIAALGGLPLKRNYYALIIDVLREAGAGQIGVDLAFTEPDREHEEYDRVLTSTVRSAGNVVFGGYFRSLTSGGDDAPADHRPHVTGERFEGPFTGLADASAGIGHTNLTSDDRIPLLITSGNARIPSLALELFRLRAGAPPQSIAMENGNVIMIGREKSYRFPVDDRGVAAINFTGGFESLRSYSVISFLQSYDSLRTGYTPSLDPGSIRGATVLLGIAAEGRSSVIATQFSERLPSMAMHAFLLNNMLHGSLLTVLPGYAGWILALLLGGLVIWIFSSTRESRAFLVTGICAGIVLLTGFALFAGASTVLPAGTVLVVLLVIPAGLTIYRHRMMRSEVERLTRQRDDIARGLGEKEHLLASLEQQLRAARDNRADDRIPQLSAEIEQYRREINVLRSQAGDVDVYEPEQSANALRKEEFRSIVYTRGSPMESVIGMIRRVAGSDATVLVSGESGTGKELVARAIHDASGRAGGPFVAVNCGALSESLLESELFGHERGAFTGAVKDRQGRFELADRGTIFLDEITETSEAFQVRLLRVLQEGTFERVGGAVTTRVDVRVIASTNRDIRAAVEEKRFREDLYYRLNVITLELPPLRERPGDIPVLVEHVLGAESPGMRVSSAVMAALQAHVWKGNVRELQSTITRGVLLAGSEDRTVLRLRDVPPEIRAAAEESRDIEDRILESLREKAFARSAISETAEELGGLSRGTVAEYFRGFCFKTFSEHNFAFGPAVEAIAGSSDPALLGRISRKLTDYLANAVEFAGDTPDPDSLVARSKPKYKNLPQRYHPVLDHLLKSYHRGDWSLPVQSSGPSAENA